VDTSSFKTHFNDRPFRGCANRFRFILNGLKHANEVLGEPVFDLADWKVIGEYVYDIQGGRHQAFYSPVRDTVVMGETIRAHERIQVEQSFKYSKEGCDRLWRSAGLLEADRWMTDDEDYGKLAPSPSPSPQAPKPQSPISRHDIALLHEATVRINLHGNVHGNVHEDLPLSEILSAPFPRIGRPLRNSPQLWSYLGPLRGRPVKASLRCAY